jgi:hypothetical protein
VSVFCALAFFRLTADVWKLEAFSFDFPSVCTTKPAPGLFAAWRNSNGKSKGLPILLMKQRDDTLYASIPLTCSSTRSPPLLASACGLICRELRWYRCLPRAAQRRHHLPLTPCFACRSTTRSALAPIANLSERDTDATLVHLAHVSAKLEPQTARAHGCGCGCGRRWRRRSARGWRGVRGDEMME